MSTANYSMQINVPWKDFGECSYFAPKAMEEWGIGLKLRFSYCGKNSWGNGYDAEGRSTTESSYTIESVAKEDALVFQILFPQCKVYLYEKV